MRYSLYDALRCIADNWMAAWRSGGIPALPFKSTRPAAVAPLVLCIYALWVRSARQTARWVLASCQFFSINQRFKPFSVCENSTPILTIFLLALREAQVLSAEYGMA